MIESGSSIAKFLNCPKSYEFAYEKLLESPYYRQPLGYGNLVHAGIETFTGKGRNGIFEKTLFELLDRYRIPQDQEMIRADFELARKVVGLWHKFWSEDRPFSNTKFEWQHAEFEWSFKIDVSLDYIHAGKSDGVVLHKEYNKVFLYELKTAADRGRDTYVHRLQVDKQISSNIMALKSKGIEVDGVIYDVIWKPGLKRLKGRKTMPDETITEFHARIAKAMEEAPQDCFERHIVYRNGKDLEEYKKDLIAQYEALHAAREKKYFYRNSGACDKFGSLCEFFSGCIEGREELEQLFNKRELKLPELSKEIQ